MLIAPALVFFALYGTREILMRLPRITARHASIFVVTASVILAAWFVYDSRHLHKHKEYAHSYEFSEKYFAAVEARRPVTHWRARSK
jgi:hypothetical protein